MILSIHDDLGLTLTFSCSRLSESNRFWLRSTESNLFHQGQLIVHHVWPDVVQGVLICSLFCKKCWIICILISTQWKLSLSTIIGIRNARFMLDMRLTQVCQLIQCYPGHVNMFFVLWKSWIIIALLSRQNMAHYFARHFQGHIWCAKMLDLLCSCKE